VSFLAFILVNKSFFKFVYFVQFFLFLDLIEDLDFVLLLFSGGRIRGGHVSAGDDEEKMTKNNVQTKRKERPSLMSKTEKLKSEK